MMMKRFLFVIMVLLGFNSLAQAPALKWNTMIGYVKLFSKSPLEDISAENKQAQVLLNTQTGDVAFKVPMSAFKFPKAAMQEHFNSPNYLDTKQFPNATFAGKITNLAEIKFDKEGSYTASVSGKMTLHGVTKDITQSGKVLVSGGKITLQAEFMLPLASYNVKIPANYVNNIAKEVKISIDAPLSPFNR